MCVFAMAADAMMMIILIIEPWRVNGIMQNSQFLGRKKRRFYIFLEFYEKELSHTIEN